MHRLVNPVMGYAWGSRTAIAELQGRLRPGSGAARERGEFGAEPEAELWLGAHPKAPSQVDGVPLDRVIAADPVGLLGAHVAARYQGELPFLLKVLAAAEPLSLQVHPSFEQARNGYAREEALGIDIADPTRNYRDPHPKPELVCALTPFTALSGFRPQADSVAILGAFGLDAEAEELARGPYHQALRTRVGAWLRLPAERRASVVTPVLTRAAGMHAGPYATDAFWIRRLGALHPTDPGLLVALLLQRFELRPFQALALDAGNLHAYLEGVAIEIMASSDNVLRGGLTPKHVDVDELLGVLRFDAAPPQATEPVLLDPTQRMYPTTFPQFALAHHQVRGEAARHALVSASIVLCTQGELALHTATDSCVLKQGESVFVGANEAWLQLAGTGDAFVASVPAAEWPST